MSITTQIISLLISVNIFLSAVSAAVLHTSSRWILDDNNHRVKFRCINWAGHMEANIPEGLQHQSAATIAQWIADNGFNCVRLTYSIDMALNPDVKVQDSFVAAASPAGVSTSDMQGIYNSIVSKNPWISSATRLSTFAKVIDDLGSRGILVILDNHVSRAQWCCMPWDGNGWWDEAFGYNMFNSQYFNTQNWLKGLTAMAKFAAQHPNVVGMGLRNELRTFLFQNPHDWYTYIAKGASAVHAANQDILIIMGGTDSSTDMSFQRIEPFDRSPYGDKVVWEFHNYEWSFLVTNGNECALNTGLLGLRTGFLLEQNKPYTGPLWLSEFGWSLNNPSAAEVGYYECLVKYMENNDAEWGYWALQGSYYVRDKTVNMEEGYGVLNRDWSGWRNASFVGALGKMWNITQGP